MTSVRPTNDPAAGKFSKARHDLKEAIDKDVAAIPRKAMLNMVL